MATLSMLSLKLRKKSKERWAVKALRRRRDGRVEVVDVLSGPESPAGDLGGREVCVVRLESGAELTIPAEEVQFID